MPRQVPVLFPKLKKQLADIGERMRLARLRRKYSAEMVAVRANLTRNTLLRIERGEPSVSFGAYASVLQVLGLQNDLNVLAIEDPLGRKLQDLHLPSRKERSGLGKDSDVRES